MKLEDAELIRQTLTGNKDAFSELVRRYSGLICGLAYHFVGNMADAEDLAQEAFIRAYQNLAQLKNQSKFGQWLRQITANLCRNWKTRYSNDAKGVQLFDSAPGSQDIRQFAQIASQQPLPDEIVENYERNNCCETGYGIEVASRVLQHSSLIIGAFEGDKLVGIARVMFDGVAASIMEFSLGLKYQGQGMESDNGSLIAKDESGLGKKIGDLLIKELLEIGAKFITFYIVENCEEAFYESLGFKWNHGHLVYYIDHRPYVNWESIFS